MTERKNATDAPAAKEGAQSANDHRQRDSVTMKVIGSFFAFFAVLVLLGTFWEHRAHAVVVNIVAGLVLFAIGAGMTIYGYFLTRRTE